MGHLRGHRAALLAVVLTSLGRSGAAQSVAADAARPEPDPMQFEPRYWERDIIFEPNDARAELFMHDKSRWRRLCTGPCTTRGLAGAYYFVQSDGVPRSRKFRIEAHEAPLRIRAGAGSSTGRTFGIVTTVVGGVVIVLGGTVGFLATQCLICTDEQVRDAQFPGWLIMGAGAVVLGTGIVLIVASGPHLDFDPSPIARAPRLQLGQGLELSADGLRF